MKLLRLKINTDFSSLKAGFEINFRTAFKEDESDNLKWDKFNPFCFAGLNGSGKSNVLEALSNIFYHLEGCINVKQPKSFKNYFNPKICSINEYELEYYIVPKTGIDYVIQNMVKVFISKNNNSIPEMRYFSYPFEEIKPIPVTVVANKEGEFPAEAKKYIPDLIIGYSSGENEILSIPFLKARLIHFDEYIEALNKNYTYNKPESNLLYIDYEMSQAVLLSNFLFQDKSVLEPLDTELDIVDIKRFRMNLNVHKEGNYRILDQFKDTVTAFKNCATSKYKDDDHLILDFWINDATKYAFKKNFDDIFKLFQSFQILYTLNYRTVSSRIKSDVYQSKGYYTDGKVPIPIPEEKVFYFLDYFIEKRIKGTKRTIPLLLKNLSDGEQQFLHSLGICLMLKNRSCLLLLDEPETHFNPDWRSKFINTLQKSLKASESNNLMMDLVITSHSPFIVSDCHRESVFVFESGKASNPKINTFGTSVNIITEEVFRKQESISGQPIDKIIEIKKMPLNTLDEIEEAKKTATILGESVEKVLLFRELLIRENELKENVKKL